MPSDFDELDFVELEMISDGFFKNREFELLKTRKIMWAVLQSQSTKNVKEENLIPLSLDEESEYKKEDLLTPEDVKRIKERIKWRKKE